jgi:hypothetical protein
MISAPRETRRFFQTRVVFAVSHPTTERGQVFEFKLNHVVEVADGIELLVRTNTKTR